MKYNKYKIQKKQVSHDDGVTWVDVAPSITRYGDYIGTFDSQEDCISGTSPSSSSFLDIEITDEMKNSLYTLIMDDGSYYVRKREDAVGPCPPPHDHPRCKNWPPIEYYWREVGWGSYDYDYAELNMPQVEWLPFWTSETDSEIRNKVRVLVIGNQTTTYIAYPYYGSTPFPKMVYVYMCDSVLEYNGPYDINVQKIRFSKNLNILSLNCPYLSGDVVFEKTITTTLDSPFVKNITIYGDLLAGSYGGNKTLLVYGSKGPTINEYGLAQLWVGGLSRMYVPDNVLFKYREPKNFGEYAYILPMSLYKIKLPTASGKGTAILYDGSAQVIPSDGTTKLTNSDLELMRNKIAYLTVSEGITELDTNCLRLADGAVTVSLPSTITTVKSIFPHKIQNIIFNGTTVPTFVVGWNNTVEEVGNIYVPDSAIMDYAFEFIDKDTINNNTDCAGCINHWTAEKLRGLSEYNYEHQDDKNYNPKECSYEYQWELSTDTECVGTTKYYLYKKQYRCEDSQEPWVDVVPKETSIDGNGTMIEQVAESCSDDCGCNEIGLIALLPNGTQCQSPCVNNSVSLCDSVSNIITLTFRDCVTSIPSFIAQNAINLVSVTMTNSVTNIGNSAFYGCSSLASVTLSSNITSIGGSAFANCTSLASITLPNGITSISDAMFSGCTSLRRIDLPTGCTSVGAYAFDGCTSLQSFSGGTSLQSIGGYAFRGCTSFERLVFSDRITSIGYASFKDCINLEYIKLYSTTPPSMINGPAFENTNDCPIYVPQGSLNAYLSDAYWVYYSSRLVEFEP